MYAAAKPVIKSWNVLQFAPDRGLDASWVARLDFSIFGGENSLNMMDTGLSIGSYDLIISNHVLEHVPDDSAAIREMLRVVGANGVIHVTVPSPTMRWKTCDWGFADEGRNFHYRDYGADFLSRAIKLLPGVKGMAVVGVDPVTGISDVVFFIAQSEEVLARLAEHWQRKPFPIVRVE